MIFWWIVLYACPPQGGTCEKVGDWPGRFGDQAYCERIADTYRRERAGDRWITKPGWTPEFICHRNAGPKP